MLYKVKFEVAAGLNIYYPDKDSFEEVIEISDVNPKNLEEELVLAIKKFLVEKKKLTFFYKIFPSFVNVNLISYNKVSG